MIMRVDAVILARGGSKGLPNKNIVEFCGKPLLWWTIRNCLESELIQNVWVSSDSPKILEVARQSDALPIDRPANLSDDFASSEVAWLHAVEFIESDSNKVDAILAPQVTSPIREASDFDRGIIKFEDGQFDSMFSACVSDDLFLWCCNSEGKLEPVNYDHRDRKRRQDVSHSYVENGSFYIFRPCVLKKSLNRLGGKIGVTCMESWKGFEIDNEIDLRVCEAVMQEFVLEGS